MFVPLSPLEFRDRAEFLFAKKIGVIDGDRQFTYAQFSERTHRLANALRDLGVQPGDRVSFITANTHQLLEAYFGVLEAGCILNPINIRLSAQDIVYILNHSGARALFYHADFAPLVRDLRDQLETKFFVAIEGERDEYEALLANARADYLAPAIDENAIAELFYTSGTTGKPKGAAITHRALYLHAFNVALGMRFSDEDVVLHIVPLFHVNGWGTPQFVTMVGGTHVMLRKVDPGLILDAIQRHRVTRLFGVPTVFNLLLAHPGFEKYDLSSLRVINLGGAPSSPTLVRAIQDRFKCNCFVGYGLTETTPILTSAWHKHHLAGEAREQKIMRESKTGYPLPGIRLRVVNSEGADVAHNGADIGEIVIQSNTVMEGYYRDPDATAHALRDGWFHTGDMAVMDDEGYVLIVDRSKDIIISGGENISSVEIENCLYAHPKIFECAVVAVPDEKWGEVAKAIVVLKPGEHTTAEEIIAHCRAQIAHFKAPKSVEFRDALPKGGTGKILKANLRQEFWRGRDKRVN
ncbi:MAG: fatty acid--CoA ligase [Chloroflexi bacterium]|nr:fatty acid--CoA ligase [Chloroflexota bacterium]